jgi:hypothetical protein
MRCTRLTALALTVMALAACGCGGSSKPLTRAELTVKADAICKHVDAKLASTNKRTSTVQSFARLAPELASFEQMELAELSKLTPPAALANDWKMIVADAQILAENTAKLGEYAKANDIKGAQGLIALSEHTQQQIIATAKRDGLTGCEQNT